MKYIILCKANGGISQVGVENTYIDAVKHAKSDAEFACHINDYYVVEVDLDKVVATGKQPTRTPWGDCWER